LGERGLDLKRLPVSKRRSGEGDFNKLLSAAVYVGGLCAEGGLDKKKTNSEGQCYDGGHGKTGNRGMGVTHTG